ncbi:hypothetical protein ONE56_18175 [Vibrio mytili]|uniref:hypothetical protein n=1 Tax=Vibrio mytili TaxID=50718 RepID=UPI003C6F6C13
MSDEWIMNEAPWWDFDTQSIHFAIEDDEFRYVVSISQITLNDYFHTVDTKDAAFENFDENSDAIFSMAIDFVEKNEPNDNDIYFISSNYFENNLR